MNLTSTSSAETISRTPSVQIVQCIMRMPLEIKITRVRDQVDQTRIDQWDDVEKANNGLTAAAA
jgi:hypothetical protein